MKTSPLDTPQFDAAWQRYLDRETSQSEEATFLAQLSETERSDLLATRTALEALERLPRFPAPVALASNVMAMIKPAKRQSAFARLRLWLRPILGWEFAGAAVAASALFVALAPLSLTPSVGGSPQVSSPLTQASLTTGASHAPDSNGNSLQFSLYAPQARSVALIGDFNGWGSAAKVRLAPSGNGMWSVTVPLPAGRYQYAFLVNGERWVTDPRAEQHVKDDFGRQNAVVTII